MVFTKIILYNFAAFDINHLVYVFTKIICNLSAERFKVANSGSLTRKLICFGSLRFGFLSAEVSSKVSRSLNVPPPVFLLYRSKTGQNVAVLIQKRDWKCVHFGLFFGKINPVFFVVDVEKNGSLYAVFFRLLVRKKRSLSKKTAA